MKILERVFIKNIRETTSSFYKTFFCRIGVLTCMVGLSGCGAGRYLGLGSYNGPIQCVPFARAESGVAIHGNAADWWAAARGRYGRSHQPVKGAVVVFKGTHRMPLGHVSVVEKVVSERRILVDQANWLPGQIEYGVPVEDVSNAHNWSVVRVWWAPTESFGKRRYPIYGFILPHK